MLKIAGALEGSQKRYENDTKTKKKKKTESLHLCFVGLWETAENEKKDKKVHKGPRSLCFERHTISTSMIILIACLKNSGEIQRSL